MTLNNTVNNWAMEIESFKIKFVHIAGKDNILADTLSRLIDINPDVELQPKLKDYEFGHYAFETLPKARSKMVNEILTSLDGVNVCEINITCDNSENSPYSVKLYAFETLPKARSKMVNEILTSLDGVNVCEINITCDNSENSPYSVKLPLSNKKFSCLQDKDLKVRQLKQKVIQGQYAQFYFIKKGVLYRLTMVTNLKWQWSLKT